MRIINTSPFAPDRMLKRMLDEGLISADDARRTYDDLRSLSLNDRKKLHRFVWPNERINI
ncbi:MAG: hypothetical protein WC516_04740 [Patescibacteria group bacterium]|jgi:hypothetical protein